MNTAILFIVFNRLDTVQKVFERLKEVKPPKLYIAADGPRNEEEKTKCENVRNYILSNIDWDCDVKTLFREKNLGCKYALKTSIDWFFESEEQGIILEDDCLASLDFFPYAENLLEKYKNDTRIMIISGNNFQHGKKWGDGSYYFSKICHIWGWATWRRAWQLYDIDMKTFPQFVKDNKIKDVFEHPSLQWHWLKNFYRVYSGIINSTWDYQFFYAVIANNGLCIKPNVNLVQNIGFCSDATHTADFDVNEYSIPIENMPKIIHPSCFVPYKEADLFEHKSFFKIDLSKSKAFCRKLFKRDKIKL